VSSECLAQIESVAELHSGNRVMLGQAAFADSDQLVLTRMPGRGQDGKLLDGRAAAEQPVVLNLLRDAQGCTIRVGGAPDARLPACTCTAMRP